MAREFPQGELQGQFDDSEVSGAQREEDLPALFHPVRGPDVPVGPAAYEGRLPVECALDGVPVGSVEDAFVAASGTSRGEINWSGLWWPDTPAVIHAEGCTTARLAFAPSERWSPSRPFKNRPCRSAAADPRQDVLESADGLLRLHVLLSARQDGAEGATTVSRQGTPAQDRFERVQSTGEKPGHAAVRTRKGDRQDSERFPQMFEPLDRRQRLLDVRRTNDVTQAGLDLTSQCALARPQLPHLVEDLLLSFLGQHRDDPSHVHAKHSKRTDPAARHGLLR